MKARTKQTIQFYWKHAKKHPWLMLLSYIGIFIGVGSSMAYPIIFSEIIDLLTLGVSAIDFSVVWFWFWMLVAAYTMSAFGWRLGVYSVCLFEPKVMERIANECFAEIHKHSYNFFNNEFVGSLVKRAGRMVRSFESFFDVITFEMTGIALHLVIGIVVLSWVHPIFGVAMITWAFVFLLVNYLISRYKLKKYDLPCAKSDSEVTAYLADSISNNINVKLFSNREYEKNEFGEVVKRWKKRSTASWMFSSHVEIFQSIWMGATELFMIYMAISLWREGSISIGSFVLIQTYLIEIFMSTWHFGRYIRRLYEAFADADEMTEILHTPIEVEDKAGAKPLLVTRGGIEMKNVDFAYTESDREMGAEGVINNLNLRIKPSERIALIGPSGGGKTTIVKLLLRLFDIQKGKILVDGQEIAKMTQDSVRKQIALVPQDPILFHRSLMENIRYGRLEASDEEVYAAAKMAHCDEFIKNMPKGYDTLVGERGVKLSGGERQRVAIARAILSNAKILILDEATSSLDVNSEKLIQEALAQLSKNKTTIVIAHRLSTVKNVDRILVLEDGKIVEEGNHTSLMKAGGLYKSLWDLSAGGILA